MNLFLALLALSFLIFFHELGHFLIARLFGVKVEVFSIGFGKKILSKTYGDTQYALSLIPLGGYVKMKGQDDSDPRKQSQDEDSYNAKKPWQRICILLAGPLFNILLAFLIYMAMGYGKREVLLPVVGEVQEGMPAFNAGIETGDRIIAINQTPIQTWGEIAPNIHQGTLEIKVQRGKENLIFTLQPTQVQREDQFGKIHMVNVIGIKVGNQIGEIHFGILDSVRLAWEQTWKNSTLILEGVKGLLFGDVPKEELGSVVTIVQVMDQASQMSYLHFLLIVALISINLGLLNLLPIPALDGGHILFNLYEMIVGRAPNTQVLYYLTLLGWAILLSLMMLGLYNDFQRIGGVK